MNLINKSLALVSVSTGGSEELRNLREGLLFSHRQRAFRRRVAYHWRKGLREPGDLSGDPAGLMGIAVATAQIGIRPGWIPEVQKLGMEVAKFIQPLF